MILQALTSYYEQLLKKNEISRPGWDDGFKVTFQVRINESGELVDLVDCRQKVNFKGKEQLEPLKISVPSHGTRSSGVAANFLCDNSSYILGVDDKGKPERTRQCFEACKSLHRKILASTDSEAARAILAFFDNWDVSKAETHPSVQKNWKDLVANSNLLLYIETDTLNTIATKDNSICEAWQNYYNSSDSGGPKAQCLITGQEEIIELVHPVIKGVVGAQSSGAAVVSFNAPAFCSYNCEQGANAPIGKYGAFAYTTALNYLLANQNNHKRIGDTTIICWAENAEPAYSTLGMIGLFGKQEDNGIRGEDVSKAMTLLSQGLECDFLQNKLEPQQRFYVLGISPNASRLSVRFFMQDTFGGFAQHIQEHAERLKIIKPSYDEKESLSIWELSMATVNRKLSNPSPSPQMAGDLLRTVLTGGRYPATLLNGVMLRIRAERDVTHARAAIIKAYYLRNTTNGQTQIPKEVLTVELNEQSNYLPYVLGRLFAVLEAIQAKANPGINTTIKDKYFTSASATPAIVFPTLINLSQKHLAKIDPGLKIYYNKQLTALFEKVNGTYPARMSLPEQGAFHIGYYHETQKRYTKKEEV